MAGAIPADSRFGDGVSVTGGVLNAERGEPRASPPVAAVTDAAGIASTSMILNQAAGPATVKAEFSGDSLYAGGTGSESSFIIEKEDVTWAYTGPTIVSNATAPTLEAPATEQADSSPGDLSQLAGTFSLTPTLTAAPFTVGTSTDARGLAAVAAMGLPADL